MLKMKCHCSIFLALLSIHWHCSNGQNNNEVFKVDNSWNSGFQASFKYSLKRKTTTGWKVTFQFRKNPILTNFQCWGGVLESSTVTSGTRIYVVKNPEYKTLYQPGEVIKIGMTGTYKEASDDAVPPSVVVRYLGRVLYPTKKSSSSRTTPSPFALSTTDLMYVINSILLPKPNPPLPENPFEIFDNNQFNNTNSSTTPKSNNSNNNISNNINDNSGNNNNQPIHNRGSNNQNSGNSNEGPGETNAATSSSFSLFSSTSSTSPSSLSPTPPSSSSSSSFSQPTPTTNRPRKTPSPKPTTTRPRPIPVTNVKTKYDYAVVLHKSILFYEAQRSGKLPKNNRIPWRGDSALNDRGDNNEDLTGGWYDAGDHVKFGFPMAYSLTMLAWGVIEYWDAYEATGELAYVMESLRWGADYIVKAHVSPFVLYGQVGDPEKDHKFWGRPEDMRGMRPSYKISKRQPGSDLAAESAAALAAVSLAVRRYENGKITSYVRNLLDHANSLLVFANTFRRLYHQSIPKATKYYKSTNFKDEIVWATAWLYRATGVKKYLDSAKGKYMNWAMFDIPSTLEFSWNEKRPGLQMLLAQVSYPTGLRDMHEPVNCSDVRKIITNEDLSVGYVYATLTPQIDPSMKHRYISDVKSYCAALRSTRANYTTKGLLFVHKWSPLRYAANSAFLCLLAADSGIDSKINEAWARRQIHYMLGDTTVRGLPNYSYVVGFGKNFPKRPHHRASTCPPKPRYCGVQHRDTTQPNPIILEGALVGGPDHRDRFSDKRADYIHSEVALDHNAGFQGAIAALQYRKMFPTIPLNRSHEPWFADTGGIGNTKTDGGGGGGGLIHHLSTGQAVLTLVLTFTMALLLF